MHRLTTIFAVSLLFIIIGAQKSNAQAITEQYCQREHTKATTKLRKRILRERTQGQHAVSLATAEKMATNVVIALDKQCASAVERKLDASDYGKEARYVYFRVLGYTYHYQSFDLTDSTTLDCMFRNQYSCFCKGSK